MGRKPYIETCPVVRVIIGPDSEWQEDGPGYCWSVCAGGSRDDIDDEYPATGGGPFGEDGEPTTVSGWLALAQEARPDLPWDSIEVEPYGWSLGGAHAPGGIRAYLYRDTAEEGA